MAQKYKRIDEKCAKNTFIQQNHWANDCTNIPKNRCNRLQTRIDGTYQRQAYVSRKAWFSSHLN